MAKTRNVAITDFSDADSLVLEMDLEAETVTFEVIQVTTSFALNDIPRASVIVATGRSMRKLAAAGLSGDLGYAKIHDVSPALRQMVEARIWANPKGEARAGKYGWSATRKIIFRGYYLGSGITYGGGRFQTVIHLIDKAFDLCCSSVASRLIHPQSTHSMIMAAAHKNLEGTGATGQKSNFLSTTRADGLDPHVTTDLTAAIKIILANFAKEDNYFVDPIAGSIEPSGQQAGPKTYNMRALKMLAQIEGPAGKQTEAAWAGATSSTPGYDLGLPLKLGLWKPKSNTPLPLPTAVKGSVQDYLYGRACNIHEHLTFWEVLVNLYCPEFHLSVVPLADRLILVADAPSFYKSFDTGYLGRTIDPEDVVRGQVGSMLSSPLRRVIVFAETPLQSFYRAGKGVPAGEYVHDSTETADGTTIGIGPPAWLMQLCNVANVSETSGITTQTPKASGEHQPWAGAKASATAPATASAADDVRPFLDNWARTMFMANLLRGRSIIIESRLRFDISPGSIVKFTMQPEQFIGAVDKQAGTWFGHVMRVITNISSEGPQCSTVYHINFARTEAENDPEDLKMRACVDQHPLFGPNIFVGAPLVKDMDFDIS